MSVKILETPLQGQNPCDNQPQKSICATSLHILTTHQVSSLSDKQFQRKTPDKKILEDKSGKKGKYSTEKLKKNHNGPQPLRGGAHNYCAILYEDTGNICPILANDNNICFVFSVSLTYEVNNKLMISPSHTHTHTHTQALE